MQEKYLFNSKEIIFYGIENRANLILRKNLSDLIEIPYLEEIFIKREFHHEAPANYGNGNNQYYYYKIVDKSENRSKIDVGEFQITEIEPEVNYFGRFDYRKIKVFDKKNNIYETFISKTVGADFIIKDLLFLVDKLKFIPNWNILTEYLRIPKLESKIQDLEKKILELRNQDTDVE